MNWGNSAAKNTIAFGFAADVTKPPSQSRDGVAGAVRPAAAVLENEARIWRTPIHTSQATPSHLTAAKPCPEAISTPASPSPASVICSALALRSPAALASERRKPLLIATDIISSWLGPGVLMNSSTVAT